MENIQAGVAQNMAENALALLRYLSAPGSPLPTLTQGYKRPTTVYFSHLGIFFFYSFQTAKIIYSVLLIASVALVRLTFVEPAPAMKKGRGLWREQARGSFAVVAGILGTIIVPNIVALLMREVLDKSMSWFSSPFAPVVLYGPPALLGKKNET